LKNVGESAPVYLRLEEFSTPLSPEIAGVSEKLALAEEGCFDKIPKLLKRRKQSQLLHHLQLLMAT